MRPVARGMYAKHAVAPTRYFHASASFLESVKRDKDSETCLYYHDIGNGTWAISLFEEAPKSPDAVTVIGKIQPGEKDPSEFVRSEPDNVTMNESFWKALHQVLKEQVASDEQMENEAGIRENGWGHIVDARWAAMPGRNAPPEAIFGSVAFTDSKIEPDSYERNNMYRFSMKHEGPMKLRAHYLDALRTHLKNN
ncbi:hypothetical protein MYAM1_002043 [Malassezia yamatoensis]|uniref:Uncharacterized protein n=1 Tax=Malassezia yamatoensis TaxID=253288 RepID=A0AAJ6CGY1_9BASI|nr:hypothetical protein MYAM1_002043 [Malassezia yamatoensis]